MLEFLKNLGRHKESQPFAFSRPIVALHSDDWGRVGVRDREGFDLLRSHGLRLGERPYDLYTLETAEDVSALAELLLRHRDCVGRAACLMMNTCMANLDFKKMRSEGFRQVISLPLSDGLPGAWVRPNLIESYRSAIESGVFQPAIHGSLHFCEEAASRALGKGGDRAELLQTFWAAETPYIFWRMPWIGYEYWKPEDRHGSFLRPERQRELIKRASTIFARLFGGKPLSACAPGYRANVETCRAWSEEGVHVAVSGTGDGLKAPHMDEFGMLHLYRNIDFEPSQHELDIEKYLEIAALCFSQGIPVIISIHSINFHSTLKDFRTASIAALDRLLSALQSKYPDMLYANDEDIYQMVMGAYAEGATKVRVSINQQLCKARAAQIGVV